MLIGPLFPLCTSTPRRKSFACDVTPSLPAPAKCSDVNSNSKAQYKFVSCCPSDTDVTPRKLSSNKRDVIKPRVHRIARNDVTPSRVPHDIHPPFARHDQHAPHPERNDVILYSAPAVRETRDVTSNNNRQCRPRNDVTPHSAPANRETRDVTNNNDSQYRPGNDVTVDSAPAKRHKHDVTNKNDGQCRPGNDVTLDSAPAKQHATTSCHVVLPMMSRAQSVQTVTSLRRRSPITGHVMLLSTLNATRPVERVTSSEHISCGEKANVMFDVSRAASDIDMRSKSQFWDDCGAWYQHGRRIVTSYYHWPDQVNRQTVYKRNDKFYIRVTHERTC